MARARTTQGRGSKRSAAARKRQQLTRLLLGLAFILALVFYRGKQLPSPEPAREPSAGREAPPDTTATDGKRESPDFATGHAKDFDAAKRSLKALFPRGEEFYCACSYELESKRPIDTESCGFKAHSSRGRRIEWEHVVPASVFGRHFRAWSAGDPSCEKNGQMQRGRSCAREVSEVFRLMEADLYNLLPAIGELNRARANFAFGEVPGEPRAFGDCDFEVKNNVVEPRPEIRGDIARIYFYMDSRYPGFNIIPPEQLPLFEEWIRSDPIDTKERERLQAIERVQGNSFFIGRLSQNEETRRKFH